MSETPKPPEGYETWLDFCVHGCSRYLEYARAELAALRADLNDATRYRDAVRASHNGYDPEARAVMEGLTEPTSPEEAIDELLRCAEEDGAVGAQLELSSLRAELDDWRNAAAHVEANHPDEHHCGCVSVLRKMLDDARAERDELKRKLDEVLSALPKTWTEP